MKSTFLTFVFATLFSSQAFSMGLFEPSFGLSLKSKSELTQDGGGGFETKGNPMFFGTRLGFQMMGLMGGLSLKQHMKTKYEFEVGNNTFKEDYSKRDLGIFLGYNLPVMLRLWGGYYFSSTWTSKADDLEADDNEKYKGSAIAFGLGYTGFPLISINLELVRSSFDKVESKDGTEFDYPDSIDHKSTDILLSVSLPLHF